jgi:hypothetical protein
MKIFMGFFAFFLIVFGVISVVVLTYENYTTTSIPIPEKVIEDGYDDEVAIYEDGELMTNVDDLTKVKELTIITESPCRYVTQIAEQENIRQIILDSRCYNNIKVASEIGSKEIDVRKFCGNTYADGNIITKDRDGNNLTINPFILSNNEVYCEVA